MFRLTKNDGQDIRLAFSGLGCAITWEEFQEWLDHVVMVSDIDDLPSYIFDLLGCKSPGEIWERPGPGGVFGFIPFEDLEDDEQAVFSGIGYARNRPGIPVIHKGDFQRIVIREEAAAALARHPYVLEWFERFFEAIGKPGELSRSG